VQGIVEINSVDEGGACHLHARCGPGQVIGEMSLLTAEPRSANVVAVDRVHVLVLPAETFHELAHEYPVLGVVLTQLVATRLGSQVHDVLAGKTFHGYRIVKRLGRGGMAVVYEAEETATGRRVALKMMSHRLVCDPTALAQFQREADIVESFEHDNIVRMYGRFEAFRTYFIVMQFVDGRPLSETIKSRGALPQAEARKIIGQVALALAYAHEHGVIHRDIKPSNIMLNRDGTVKLMDFGLARPVLETEGAIPEGIVGTPRYMPPELLSGGSASRATDYFALGCVVYEMLAGRPVLPKLKLTDLLQYYETWQPPAFHEIQPPLSRELCEAFQPSLSKDPRARRLDLSQAAAWAGLADPSLIAPQADDPPDDVGDDQAEAD
jgi:serine/threonine protein kinase